MLEQAGVGIIWYAHFTEDGVGKTGLTGAELPTISVYKNNSGTPEVDIQDMTELARGIYYYQQTPADEGFRVALAYTSNADVDQAELPAIMMIGKAGIENLDAAVSSRNATTPDAAGVAAGLHGTTDGLIGALVVPDAAGVVSGLMGSLETHGDSTWATAAGFSTHTATNVWEVGTRTLSSFGTLVADIATAVWNAGTRTLSAFGFAVATDAESRTASKADVSELATVAAVAGLPSAADVAEAVVARDEIAALLSMSGYYKHAVEVLSRDATTGEVLTASHTMYAADGTTTVAIIDYTATVDDQGRITGHQKEPE